MSHNSRSIIYQALSEADVVDVKFMSASLGQWVESKQMEMCTYGALKRWCVKIMITTIYAIATLYS